MGGVVWKNYKFGGPGRDRTDDLFHAMEARSQLRHRPNLLRKAIATVQFSLSLAIASNSTQVASLK